MMRIFGRVEFARRRQMREDAWCRSTTDENMKRKSSGALVFDKEVEELETPLEDSEKEE
jgi:hypothetical protein